LPPERARRINLGIASGRSYSAGGLLLLGLVGAGCILASPRPDVGAVAGGWGRAPAAAARPAGGGGPAAEDPPAAPDAADAATAREEDPDPPLVDNWSLVSREDGDACREELKAAGFKFQPLPERKQVDRAGCGVPHGVVVVRGPTGIAYEPPIMVDCTLARALGSVERIVQEEAELHLGSPITRIGNLGGYACRPRNFRKGSSLSAHAFGSAVDLSSFHPQKGQPAIVARDYADVARAAAGREVRQRFLRGVFVRLRRHEADLTYAVGPDFNATHHDHFHLDRGGWYFWFNREARPVGP
jgi:hypothetical protein